MRTGLTVQTFYGHLNTINDAQFSIDGRYFSTCDSDGIVKMWDNRMVQELLTVDTGDFVCHSLCFDKSTQQIAVGCADHEIKLINIANQEVSGVLKGHDDAVNSVHINHDNSALYSASNDGTIRMWK